jgi:ankyrin repeat protein
VFSGKYELFKTYFEKEFLITDFHSFSSVLLPFVIIFGAFFDKHTILQLGRNALHWAAEYGFVDITKLLLQDSRFTEINTTDREVGYSYVV